MQKIMATMPARTIDITHAHRAISKDPADTRSGAPVIPDDEAKTPLRGGIAVQYLAVVVFRECGGRSRLGRQG